jgi:hypothetical protein
MGDTGIKKVSSLYSPAGEMGQKYLASGVRVSMRLWENLPPGHANPPTVRDYETVGLSLRVVQSCISRVRWFCLSRATHR